MDYGTEGSGFISAGSLAFSSFPDNSKIRRCLSIQCQNPEAL